MKILHIMQNVEDASGGPPRALLALLKATRSARPETSLSIAFGASRGPSTFEKAIGDLARPYAFPQFGRAAFAVAPGLLRWLGRFVREYDLVHIHAFRNPTCDFSALICSSRRVPYILRPLGTLGPYSFEHRRRWLKSVHMSTIGRRVIGRASGVHFTAIREMADASRYVAPPLARVVPIPVEKPGLGWRSSCNGGILFVGRLHPVKGIEQLLRAFAIEADRSAASRQLIIVGDGPPPYKRSLQALATELGIAERVLMLGHMSPDEVQEMTAQCGVFVMASATENFGMAIAESLAIGAPVVVADSIALAEPLRQAGAAEVVARRPDAIAKGIARVLTVGAYAQALSAAGKAFVDLHFSDDRIGTELCEWYDKLVKTAIR